MKKYFIGLVAIVLAVGAVAFTKPSAKPAFNLYYFRLDPSSGLPLQYSKSTNNSPDMSPQTDCTTGAQYCEEAWSSFSVSGTGPYTYTAAGTAQSATLTKQDLQ